MTLLRVLACGPGTTVQDLGRTGYRRFGVTGAGAMDGLSLALANALCGNGPEAAGIEIALAGARLVLQDGPAILSAVGAGLTVDGRPQAPDCAVRVALGAQVVLGPVRTGVYAYLAVAGGIATAPQMGSRAVHARSGIGGRALAPGDKLPLGSAPSGLPRRLSLPVEAGPIRVILGPQDDWFTAAAVQRLLSAAYTVHPRSDRMAIRLAGPPLAHARGYNIVTDAVLAGSVQVPGDGQPLVLMRDCQTAGGYPKIATVISADLDRLAQVRPGTSLRFAAVPMAEARAAARARAALIRGLPARAQALADPFDPVRLLSENLISGVVDGR